MSEEGNLDPTVRHDGRTPVEGKTPPGDGGAPDAMLGQVLDDRFKLRLVLGEGGMGRVYLAEDLKLNGRRVAVKVMGSSISQDDEFRARFAREAILQANLPHPQIVQILDIGECDEGSYIVMEYSGGRPLSRIIKELGPRNTDHCLRIVEQMLQVLDFAHGQGVVHRDLKPSNILVEERAGREHVKLLDFGIAKLLGTHQDNESQLTLTKAGFAYGTLGYMAPEQACGDLESMDHRADLYAVGVILQEMLTGEVPAPPEERTHPVRYAMWVQQNPIPALSESHPELDIDPGVESILRKAMARKPELRYPSALAFIQDVRDVREGAAPKTANQGPRDTVDLNKDEPTTRVEGLGSTVSGGKTSFIPWGIALASLLLAGFFFMKSQSSEGNPSELDETQVVAQLSQFTDEVPSDVEDAVIKIREKINILEENADPETLGKLRGDLDANRKTINKLRDDIVDKDAERKREADDRRDAEDELEALEEKYNKLESSGRQHREEWATEKAKLEGELKSLRLSGGNIDEKVKEIEKLAGEKSALASKLSAAEEDRDRYKTEADQLKKNYEADRKTLGDTRSERDQFRTKYNNSVAEQTRLQNELTKLRQNSGGGSRRVQELEGRLRQKDMTIQQKDQEIRRLLNQLGNRAPIGQPFMVKLTNNRLTSRRIKVTELLALDSGGRPTTITLPSGGLTISLKQSKELQVPAGTVGLQIKHSEWGTDNRLRNERVKRPSVSPQSSTVILN